MNVAGMHVGCGCCSTLSRRSLLRGSFSATATSAAIAAAAGSATRASAQVSGPGGAPEGSAPRGRVIDTHAHYYPAAYLELFNREGRPFGGEFRTTDQAFFFKAQGQGNGPLPLKFIDLKQRLADMDAQGVAVHALSLSSPMVYWGDHAFSHLMARTWNDAALAASQAHPDRFVVLAALPMLDPDRAIDELNRVSALAPVRGIYLGTNIDGRDLDDPLFEPAFARIEALGLPVFLHPVAPSVGGKRLLPFSFTNMIAYPFDTAIAACHLIFGGVMDRHPNLQVNLPHAGGVLPILIGRLDHGWSTIPEARKMRDAPSAYLRRFTYDTIAHSKPIMEFIIAQVGADRIMLGSDYCYPIGDAHPVDTVEALPLNARDRQMILGGTAAKLLRL